MINEITPDIVVLGEAGPLHQVFLNLLVNAIHAIEMGKRPERKVRLSPRRTSTGWEISVSDTGCGISEKNMKQIFKPFFTTKEIGKGTGLGLATSFRIIGNWGGRISVASREGFGSTFTLHLKHPNYKSLKTATKPSKENFYEQ